MTWITKDSTYLFESTWFNLRQDRVELPSGNEITYTFVDHPGFVVVVPVLDNGNVLLEKIFRYTVQDRLLECPAGGLEGGTPETAARRELREETGYTATDLTHLGKFCASTGISNSAFDAFLATGLHDTGVLEREETEEMELVEIPLDEAVALARSGGITCAPSALAILLAHGRLTSR
jgi:ADP-ribose pyrophosphatase